MADTIYKLPLDGQTDNDLIVWLNSLPRNKKAEVVRHALRFYKSQLKEGETFIMPSGQVDTGARTVDVIEEKQEEKKRPPAGLLTNITKQQ